MIFDDYLWEGLHHIGNWHNPCTGINCFLFQYKDNIELLDGFEPPVRQINTRLLYNNQSYQSLYQHNFNYQMFVKKL